MANSQSHDNGTSSDQENSPDLLKQDSLKDSTILNRLVDSRTISSGGFKFTEVCKDAMIKIPTNEKRKPQLQGSLLVEKHWPPRNSVMPETLANPFPNGTFDSAIRNHNTPQRGKDITDAEKTYDLHFHGRSSRPSKPTTDDTHMRAKGPALYTSNQIRGDLPPKSVGGDKVHVSTKSSQKPRTDNENQKFTLSGGQKTSVVGHTKSSRRTTAFTGRKS